VLINNAGIASMNHLVLTPLSTVSRIFSTNVFGTFLVMREVAKVMMVAKAGRIVNFATVATPMNLEGEAGYAASKAAVESLTRVAAREFAAFNVTVNAVGPTPVMTDLIRSVPKQKMDALIATQAIRRMGEHRDIANVIDFFIRPESDFVTGQTLYLGGIS
jgi:3-oxoacyl-[acyl-carrier protein] reductase